MLYFLFSNNPANNFTVSGTEQRRNVLKIITKNFDAPTFLNDIALLKLDYPLNFFASPAIAPLCIPDQFQKFHGEFFDFLCVIL